MHAKHKSIFDFAIFFWGLRVQCPCIDLVTAPWCLHLFRMKISALGPITKLWIAPVSPSAGQQWPQGHRLSILCNWVLGPSTSCERIISSPQSPQDKQILKETSTEMGQLCRNGTMIAKATVLHLINALQAMPTSLHNGISAWLQAFQIIFNLSSHHVEAAWFDFCLNVRIIVKNTNVSESPFCYQCFANKTKLEPWNKMVLSCLSSSFWMTLQVRSEQLTHNDLKIL